MIPSRSRGFAGRTRASAQGRTLGVHGERGMGAQFPTLFESFHRLHPERYLLITDADCFQLLQNKPHGTCDAEGFLPGLSSPGQSDL